MGTMKNGSDTRTALSAGIVFTALSLTACTGQLKDSFRFAQQYQTFPTVQQINTKIDLLWVVDNSASMDVSQAKLRQGFASFAAKYMKTYWDIRIAVISTDVYLANPAFDNYINQVMVLNSGDPEQVQPAQLKSVILGRIAAVGVGNMATDSVLTTLGQYATIANDATAGTLKKNAGGKPILPLGALVPSWLQRQNYAKLIAGIHDGPITGFCASPEFLPYFHNANVNNCTLRDDAVTNLASTDVGTANCLNNAMNGTMECVNTLANNTVHSGMPIISTQLPTGETDASWSQKIVDAFMVNATTGAVGHGSERAFSSVLEFMRVNEVDQVTKFFRKNSLRGIIFVGDEDDQTVDLPAAPTQLGDPFKDYACDQADLVAKNPASAAQIQASYCCSGVNADGSNKCRYGRTGTSCTQKTVDGQPWKVDICPVDANLLSVATVKQRFDNFFLTLDGKNATGDPGYFVATIVPQAHQTLSDLQTLRDQSDAAVNQYKSVAVDRGDRYMALANTVGNGSLTLELGSPNFDTLLDTIGQTIVQKEGTFQLARAPTGFEQMQVFIVHADGTIYQVQPAQMSITGSVLTLTDLSLVLSLKSTDLISLNYQPKS